MNDWKNLTSEFRQKNHFFSIFGWEIQFSGWQYRVIHLYLRLITFYGASVTPIGSKKTFPGDIMFPLFGALAGRIFGTF